MAIEKRGKGWRVRWRDLGGQERSQQVRTRKAAEEIWRGIQDARDRCHDYRPPRANSPAAQSSRLLVDAAADYLIALQRSRAASTVTVARYAIQHLIAVAGEEADITALDRGLIERLFDAIEASQATRSRYISAVRVFWEWAYDHDEWGELLDERRHRPRQIDLPRLLPSPTRAPTWAQCDAMIALLEEGTIARRLAILCRYTGLRVGQAGRLEWRDFDIAASELVIRPELGKTTQEKRGRVVPVSRHLVAELAGWGQRNGIVCGGCHRSSTQTIPKWWARAGVDPALWRGRPHHALRKAFVSELHRRGADPSAVEYLVGHASGVRGVYLDPLALPLRETVDLVEPVGHCVQVGHISDTSRSRC